MSPGCTALVARSVRERYARETAASPRRHLPVRGLAVVCRPGYGEAARAQPGFGGSSEVTVSAGPIIAIVVVLVILAVVAALAVRRSTPSAPYGKRRRRVDGLGIKPLSPEQRTLYGTRWVAAQEAFISSP